MDAAPLWEEVDEAGELAVVEDPAAAAGMPVAEAEGDVDLTRPDEVASDALEVGRAVREAAGEAEDPPLMAVTA